MMRSITETFYTVRLLKSVDHEQDELIQAFVTSTEQGSPTIVQTLLINFTVLDVNDNPPSLGTTQFNLTEERRQVLNLTQYVTDPDNGNNGTVGSIELITVRNDTSDLTSMFQEYIDEWSGIFNTTVDREELGNVLRVTVNITDMGEPPLSQVAEFTVEITDINDNSPVFAEPSYTFYLQENMDRGTHVGRVQADDPDYLQNGVVEYEIVDQNDSPFDINFRSGDISSEAPIDRESRAMYNITVQARDKGDPQKMAKQSVSVVIFIGDEDDEDPVFAEAVATFTITTASRPGSVVGMVSALDKDVFPNNRTVYKLESGSSLFKLPDNSSGIIKLTEAITTMGSFSFNVSAFNPGREQSGDTITVNVLVEKAQVSTAIIAGSAAGAAFVFILIIVVVCLIMCVHCVRNQK